MSDYDDDPWHHRRDRDRYDRREKGGCLPWLFGIQEEPNDCFMMPVWRSIGHLFSIATNWF